MSKKQKKDQKSGKISDKKIRSKSDKKESKKCDKIQRQGKLQKRQ